MEGIRPSADLRNHYNDIAENCRKNREAVFITKNGREDTVLMSSVDYRSMKSELELLRMLAESDEDIRQGRVSTLDSTFDEMRRVVAERLKA